MLLISQFLAIGNESVLQYVSDYKLNLIAPCEISDFSKFNTSPGPVLQLLRVANDENAMGNLITTNLAVRELENLTKKRRLRICVKHGMIIIGVEFSRENMQKGEEHCSSPKWLRNMNITEVMIIHLD